MFRQNSAIQAVPSACSRWPPVGSGALRSKMPILSRPRNPPSNTLRPNRSLRFTHQVKFSISLLKVRLRNSISALAPGRLLAAVQEDHRPGQHRRIDVAEIPLIGRHLAVRVQIDFLQHQLELLLGEVDIDRRQRDRVEGEVPGRVPRIFPLVRHRDHVAVDHVVPVAVPHGPRSPVGPAGAVLGQPAVGVELVVLLGPQHAGHRLAHDVGAVGVGAGRNARLVEGVGLALARRENRIELGAKRRCRRREPLVGQTQADDRRSCRGSMRRR